MKFIISILIVLLSFNSFSQDTIKISQSEINGVISAMDTLMKQDSINNILIEQQTIQINNFKTLTK